MLSHHSVSVCLPQTKCWRHPRFFSPASFLRATAVPRTRISYGNSVHLSVRLSWWHNSLPNKAQVK